MEIVTPETNWQQDWQIRKWQFILNQVLPTITNEVNDDNENGASSRAWLKTKFSRPISGLYVKVCTEQKSIYRL